jgi:hypothetical protein
LWKSERTPQDQDIPWPTSLDGNPPCTPRIVNGRNVGRSIRRRSIPYREGSDHRGGRERRTNIARATAGPGTSPTDGKVPGVRQRQGHRTVHASGGPGHPAPFLVCLRTSVCRWQRENRQSGLLLVHADAQLLAVRVPQRFENHIEIGQAIRKGLFIRRARRPRRHLFPCLPFEGDPPGVGGVASLSCPQTERDAESDHAVRYKRDSGFEHLHSNAVHRAECPTDRAPYSSAR